MEMNEFEKLMGFFHDGSIDHIKQHDRNIYLWMESAQLQQEWIDEFNVHVNDNMSIKGVFLCLNVKKLIIDHIPQTSIQMNYDVAEILDFDVEGAGISLLVLWRQWGTGFRPNISGLIKIEADKFYWKYDEYVSASSKQKFKSSYKPCENGYMNSSQE